MPLLMPYYMDYDMSLLAVAGLLCAIDAIRHGVDRRLAIVLDGQLYSAPVIRAPMENGLCAITGNFDDQEAKLLADLMEEPLPVPVTLMEFKTF